MVDVIQMKLRPNQQHMALSQCSVKKFVIQEYWSPRKS